MFFPSASDLDPIMGGILANLDLHRVFQVNEDWLNHENRKPETCSKKLRCLGESAPSHFLRREIKVWASLTRSVTLGFTQRQGKQNVAQHFFQNRICQSHNFSLCPNSSHTHLSAFVMKISFDAAELPVGQEVNVWEVLICIQPELISRITCFSFKTLLTMAYKS